MKDLGTLIARLTVGLLLAGHGAQKLFGWFGGHGLQGTATWLESMGLRPGPRWAALAGGSEFGGGDLTAAGLLSPLGPMAGISAMAMAAGKAHAGRPIWVTEGGAELPLTNGAVLLGLALRGPGRYSLDRALDIHVPGPVVFIAGAAAAAGLAVGLTSSPEPPAQPAVEEDAGGGMDLAA